MLGMPKLGSAEHIESRLRQLDATARKSNQTKKTGRNIMSVGMNGRALCAWRPWWLVCSQRRPRRSRRSSLATPALTIFLLPLSPRTRVFSISGDWMSR